MKTETDLSNRPTSSVSRYVQEHPVITAILILLADLVISTLCGLAAKLLFPQYQPEFIVIIALSILVAISLTLLGWWNVAGFNRPSVWRSLPLAWVPWVIVLVLPFLQGFKSSSWGTFFYLLIAYALTGFTEEGLMRGIVLRILQPLGVTRSVVISSLLFGLMHVANLLYRNPFIVLAQMVGAFVHGVGLAAIRLRSNTIWLVVILHGLHDLVLRYTNFPLIPLDVVQVTLLMLYGIYLLRNTTTPTVYG